MTLGTKVNQVVVSIFILATILYTALLLYFQHQRMEMMADKISVFLNSIACNNTKSLANELFENRPRAIKIRLENIINIHGIDYAAVFDAQFKNVTTVGKDIEKLTPADVKITISIGLASMQDHPESNLTQILALADKALYHSKETGRNRVSINLSDGIKLSPLHES